MWPSTFKQARPTHSPWHAISRPLFPPPSLPQAPLELGGTHVKPDVWSSMAAEPNTVMIGEADIAAA